MYASGYMKLLCFFLYLKSISFLKSKLDSFLQLELNKSTISIYTSIYDFPSDTQKSIDINIKYLVFIDFVFSSSSSSQYYYYSFHVSIIDVNGMSVFFNH